MYSTYKLMSNCTKKQYLDKSLEDLCKEYNATENAGIRNKIVAAMFIKVFPMIQKIQSKYYSLTNEQKVDHALFHLVRSIKYYKNNNVKFSSFFHTHLTNQMKTLLSSENSLKKAAFQNIVRDNDNVLTWYAKNESMKDYEQTERYMLQCLKDSSYLSTEEKEFCACVLAGYDKMATITEKLNLNERMSTNPIKSVNINDFDTTKKIDTKYARKIKKSLKEKYAKYGDKIFC